MTTISLTNLLYCLHHSTWVVKSHLHIEASKGVYFPMKWWWIWQPFSMSCADCHWHDKTDANTTERYQSNTWYVQVCPFLSTWSLSCCVQREALRQHYFVILILWRPLSMSIAIQLLTRSRKTPDAFITRIALVDKSWYPCLPLGKERYALNKIMYV